MIHPCSPALRSSRRIILAVVFVALAVPFAPAAPAEPPNVILVITDDQGYGDVGAHGNTMIQTPNLDKLHAESVRLVDFHVDPTCSPTRSALMSGRYSTRTGVWHTIMGRSLMSPREVTVAEVFKAGGYRTGMFGKWHLGDNFPCRPQDQGFDEAFYHGGGGVGQGPDYWGNDYFDDTYFRNGKPEKVTGYCTDVWFANALEFIDRNKDRPFFLYLPFNAPHGASNLDPKIRTGAQAPEQWRKMYPELYQQEGSVEGTRYGKPALVANRALRKTHYLGAVTAMDAAIGDVLDLLDEYGLAENTIVIFFSDNGGSGGADNSPLRAGKSRVFEGGVRVCCLVRYPKRIAPGTVNGEFVTSLEIFPTVLKLAGVAPPEGVVLDGFDMMPMLAEGKPSPRTEMYWKRRAKEAARVGHWKWIRNESGTFLFDLSKDLSEKDNLVDKLPDKAAKMQTHFENWLKRMDEADPRGPFRDF